MKIRILILILFCISSNAYPQIWSKQKNEVNETTITFSNEKLLDSLNNVTDSLNSANNKIKGFSVIRDWMEKHLIDNYGGYYIKSLLELDTCLIDSLMTIGRSVQSTDLDTLLQGLYDAKTRLRQYITYNKLTEIEYDSIAIAKAMSDIDTILAQCSDIQKKEFEELLGKLDLEIDAITELYNIVYEITYRAERYRKDNDDFRAMRTAEELLKRHALKYKDYISKIPYTDSLYSNFKKAILENPLEVSEYEKKILSFESLITNN